MGKVVTTETYSTNDTVGMGIHWPTKRVFVTKNGRFLVDRKFSNDVFELSPSVGSMCIGDTVKINYGKEPFVFDILPFLAYHHFKLEED